jgi:hypothetical protein
LNGVQFKDLFFPIYAQTIIRDSAMIAVFPAVSGLNQYRKIIKICKWVITY